MCTWPFELHVNVSFWKKSKPLAVRYAHRLVVEVDLRVVPPDSADLIVAQPLSVNAIRMVCSYRLLAMASEGKRIHVYRLAAEMTDDEQLYGRMIEMAEQYGEIKTHGVRASRDGNAWSWIE